MPLRPDWMFSRLVQLLDRARKVTEELMDKEELANAVKDVVLILCFVLDLHKRNVSQVVLFN